MGISKRNSTTPSISRPGHFDAGLAEAWQDLLERAPSASVFQTLAWHECWWRAFGGEHELCVVLVHDGTRLAGIAPMMISHERAATGRRHRTMRFIGSVNHASDYCDFIVDPGTPWALGALLDELASLRCDRYILSHVPGASAHRVAAARHLHKRGLRVADDVQNDAPVRLLGDEAADRKAVNKSSLKRNRNYFRAQGELRFERVRDVDAILGRLDAFFDQHRSRRAITHAPSQFHDPVQCAFYRDLVRELAPRGWLCFDEVLLDGAPLAFHLGFEFRGCFLWYKPTFDIHAPKSPGQVLLQYLLGTAIDDGLSEFDFTCGAEDFKLRFANEVRQIHEVSAFASTADYWRHRSRRALKERFGRKP